MHRLWNVQRVEIMTTSLVTPGTEIGSVGEHQAGEGAIAIEDRIVATTTGYMRIEDGHIIVDASKSIVNIEIGDTVLCQFEKLQEKGGEARILIVEGKSGDVLPHQLHGHFHVTRIVDRFLHTVADAVRRRDIARAVVTEVEPVVRLDFRERKDCGVLHAICPPCGATLEARVNGDWNVMCPTCNYESYRALADNFGSGWADLEEGASALNLAGKRWGKEAEQRFAQGSSGRATFIAADVREDGRERTYFRFEGQGQSGGRRQKSPPGCRLFVGGLPREIDTEQLRELFAKHGEMSDCIVMTDDAGVSRGFGFVTYTDKAHADAAIKQLDGHRLHGRRIGVRDADNKEKRAKNQPKGLKLYVGNLPFDADEKAISAFFGEHATINEIAIATDKSGKPKGFAFVFIKEEDSGDKVVKALNGQELNGRRIKVDISQGGGKKKTQGGKSSRELRAIAEEKNNNRRR
tara:strand:- start:647 stop:2035 length:1389 start_codon:yes stop_codon:yes gene_type:complete